MGLEELSPEKRAAYLERLDRMPLVERARMALDLMDRGRTLMLAGLRHRNPSATERQLQRMVAEALCGAEFARRAYGDR